MTTYAVVGSRTIRNYDRVARILAQFSIDHIISGGAQGVDSLAQEYAKKNAIPITIYYPNWDQHGKSAGYRRNVLIVDECDEVIAFQRAKSKGTQHTIDIARQAGKPVHVFSYTEGESP